MCIKLNRRFILGIDHNCGDANFIGRLQDSFTCIAVEKSTETLSLH